MAIFDNPIQARVIFHSLPDWSDKEVAVDQARERMQAVAEEAGATWVEEPLPLRTGSTRIGGEWLFFVDYQANCGN